MTLGVFVIGEFDALLGRECPHRETGSQDTLKSRMKEK